MLTQESIRCIKNEIIPMYERFLRQELNMGVEIDTTQLYSIKEYISEFWPLYPPKNFSYCLDMMLLSPVLEDMYKRYL